MLAIVRAVEAMPERGVLVLDEPTAFLPVQQRERLFASSAGSPARIGRAGRLPRPPEVRALADRITVLRDGRNAGTVMAGEVETGALVELWWAAAGPVAARARRTSAAESPCRDSPRRCSGHSFDLGKGEVVGVTGLPGRLRGASLLLFGARRQVPAASSWTRSSISRP